MAYTVCTAAIPRGAALGLKLALEKRLSSDCGKRRRLFAGLALVFLVAFLVRLYSAFRFPNIHYPDEIFQYIEQAHRLVFGYGVIPWEFRDGTRSWLIPGFLAGLLKASDIVGLSQPETYLFFVILSLSALSLSVVIVGALWALRTQGPFAAIIVGGLTAVWFELIYFAPKTLSEPIAAHLLLIALYVAYPGQPITSKRRLFAAGLLFGAVFAMRVHLAPAILVASIYICRQHFSDKWLPLALGGIITFLSAGLLDAFTWEYPFQSFVSNIWINLVEHKSENYGTEPWFYFGKRWVSIWNGATVPMMFFVLIAVRRNILLGIVAATIVATHMVFAHKEYRFVYPALPFIIILVGLGTATAFNYVRKDLNINNSKLIAMAQALLLVGWTTVSAVLAFGDHFREYWFKWAGEIQAFHLLYHESDLCGVGLIGMSPAKTGGYTHLHRNVPIIIPLENLNTSFSAFNYAIAPPPEIPASWPYSKVKCWGADEVCVYHRPGSCENAPRLELNEVLRRLGG